MAIKSIDSLEPAGDFALIDFNDVDQNVNAIITTSGYDPGASPDHGTKYIMGMDPGTDGANLHPNFSGPDKLSPDAKSNVAELDILQ